MSQQIDPSAIPSANLPVIPDAVVEKIQKGEDVPLEQISRAAAEMKAARDTDKARPLHQETLTPTTRAHANTLMTGNPQGHLQRGTMPRAPSTRRVIPPPFKRESISIRVPGEPVPEWRNLRASQVLEGDIVPGVGRVISSERRTRYADAAEQVPVFNVFRDEPLAPVQEYTGDDARKLTEAYGSTLVAVGIDIVLTGPEGNELVVDEQAEVQAFGFSGTT